MKNISEIKAYLEGFDCDSSVLVWEVSRGQLFGHQESRLFPAASVIKAGILGCLASRVEQGFCRWDQELAIKEEDIVGGAGVLPYLRQRPYTLEELASLMIVVSDNTASNVLGQFLTRDLLNRWLESIGCRDSFFRRWFMERPQEESELEWGQRLSQWFDKPCLEAHENTLTALDTRLIFDYLAPGGPLSRENQEKCWSFLKGQQFIEKLQGALPKGWSAAHKTGELPFFRMDSGWLISEKQNLGVVIFVHHPSWTPSQFDQYIAGLARLITGHV